MESAIGDAVAQIVDHHVDEGMYGTAVRDIQLVGSCSTLVVRVLRELLQLSARSRGGAPQAEHISREAPALLDDAALRTMLLGAVLLDTGNLTGISVRLTARVVHAGGAKACDCAGSCHAARQGGGQAAVARRVGGGGPRAVRDAALQAHRPERAEHA